jgi:hypothetical protein
MWRFRRIVEAGGAGGFVAGHLLRDFELAAVAQILRDPGRAEGVATRLGGDAGVGRAPTDHAVDVRLAHGAASEDAGLAFGRCRVSLISAVTASAGGIYL